MNAPNLTLQEIHERGVKRLIDVDAEAGERVIDSLQSISPDLANYVIDFGFGHIYSRKGLTLQQRELATIAALTALANAEPQLKVHLYAALNVGLSRTEITETIIQMAVYAGFPAALNAMLAAKAVFADNPPIDKKPNHIITAQIRVLDGIDVTVVKAALNELAHATRAEAGCLQFDIQHNVKNPDHFTMWERFVDEAAFKLHFEMPHTKAYLAQRLTEPVMHWETNDFN